MEQDNDDIRQLFELNNALNVRFTTHEAVQDVRDQELSRSLAKIEASLENLTEHMQKAQGGFWVFISVIGTLGTIAAFLWDKLHWKN